MILHSYSKYKGILKESVGNTGEKVYYTVGKIQEADQINQNGRIYPRSILELAVERYKQSFVRQGNAYGELDHPDSEIVEFKNTSHIIVDLWWEGNSVFAKIELLPTPQGEIVRKILERGHAVGISSRATGSVINEMNKTLVQEDLDFICWDFVTNPSTYGAFQRLNESKEHKQLHGLRNEIDTDIREILCMRTGVCSL